MHTHIYAYIHVYIYTYIYVHIHKYTYIHNYIYLNSAGNGETVYLKCWTVLSVCISIYEVLQ